MSPPSHQSVEQPLSSGSTSPQLTPLRLATPAPDDNDYTSIEPDATEPDQAEPLRLTTSPNLLAFRSDLMMPRRTMPLLPMLILPMLTW
uniref:Uncharacterized protein n=1 Tax=Peronospora matthiolae TaxID=2874970 RepID=A0AAV1TL14_9STRA